MAQRIYRFELVAPTGTTVVNNVTERLIFPPGVVSGITVEIPSGHAGKTGIAIFFGENQVIPLGGTSWLKGNKKTTHYDFDDPFPGTNNWWAVYFNRGKRPHTFRLAFEVDDAAVAGLLPPVVLLPVGSGSPELFGEDVPLGTTPPDSGGGGDRIPV